MKKNLSLVMTAIIVGAIMTVVSFAQDDKVVSAAGEMYVISAKAGGVNYVEGKVAVARVSGKSGQLLKDDKLEIGDRVTTDVAAKAEILLNPGSFVRLAGNSSFEFVSTDLENLKLRLSSGSAILEVYADDEFKVTVALPNGELVLTRSGVYRLDVLSNGTARLSVWKGRAFVGENQAEVKGGRAAILNGRTATVEKFDRDNKDEFFAWSQLRAKEAARINARLQRDALQNTLLSSFNLGRWNMYNTFGLWVFDRFTGRWCFLPFGSGWSSPWGYDYGFNIWNCRLPRYVYNAPPPPVVVTPTPTGNGNTTVSENPSNQVRGQRLLTPTFQRFENNNGGGSGGGSGGVDTGGSGGINPGPSRNDGGSSRRDTWNDSRKDNPDSSVKPTYNPPPPRVEPQSPPIFVPSTPKSGKEPNR